MIIVLTLILPGKTNFPVVLTSVVCQWKARRVMLTTVLKRS